MIKMYSETDKIEKNILQRLIKTDPFGSDGYVGPYAVWIVKRYLADGQDEFSSHVDVRDYKDAKRFLTFFIYLDDNEGGRTSFPQIGKHANCKKGDILIFPPMWPWLHAGEKPIEKSKYILHSYLHYTWTKDE